MKFQLPNYKSQTSSNDQIPMIGIEPVSDVVTMEYHNDAYKAWCERGVKGKILFHLDGHIDFGFFADQDPKELLEAKNRKELNSLLDSKHLWKFNNLKKDSLINIGNYIYPAIKEGMVKSFYWVVPDPIWNNSRQRGLIKKVLKNITCLLPPSDQKIYVEDNAFMINVYGCPVTVLSLDSLPEIDENVLLDIDTDFLLTYSIDAPPPYYAAKAFAPWINTKDVIKKLAKKKVRSDLVTIAYSVEGGYTPLKYRYLGDELACLLKRPTALRDLPEEIKLRQTVEGLLNQGSLDDAIIRMEDLLRLKPDDAAVHYRLFRAWQKKGDHAKAALHYKKAVNIDAAYNTSYNNYGLRYISQGRLKNAKQEYDRMLDIDPHNVEFLCGLAEIAVRKKEWTNAKQICFLAMELDPNDVSVYNRLGDILTAMGDRNSAVKAFNEVLAKAPHNAWAYYKLGDIYFKDGDAEKAINAYRQAKRLGFISIGMHFRLASLYRNKGNWYKVKREYRKALWLVSKQGPSYMWRWLTYIPRVLLGKRYYAGN